MPQPTIVVEQKRFKTYALPKLLPEGDLLVLTGYILIPAYGEIRGSGKEDQS